MSENNIPLFLNRVSSLINPVKGPFTKLNEQPQISYLPGLYSYRAVFKDGDHETMGLGFDKNIEVAITKAIAEGLERYNLARQYKEIIADPPLDSKRLPTKKILLGSKAEQNIGWIKFFDRDNQEIWLPIFTGARYNSDKDLINSTNGIGAHFDFKSALTKAILEIIERDAFMVGWLCKIEPRLILIDSINDGNYKKIVKRLEKDGHKTFLFDISLDIPIHTICTLIADKYSRYHIGLGIGWAFNNAVGHSLQEALLFLDKSGQCPDPDIATAIAKLNNFDIDGHNEYHWALKNNTHFDYMINTKKNTTYSDYITSKKWLNNMNELLILLRDKGIEYYYRKLGDERLINIVKCVIPSMQTLIYGTTTPEKINFDRLHELGLKWVCDTPHPLC